MALHLSKCKTQGKIKYLRVDLWYVGIKLLFRVCWNKVIV